MSRYPVGPPQNSGGAAPRPSTGRTGERSGFSSHPCSFCCGPLGYGHLLRSLHDRGSSGHRLGQPLGVVWKPPYRVDATKALRKGINRIEIRVTNEWTNRIVGDRAAQPDERVLTGTEGGFGRRPRELDVSGLLGPVRILAAE